MGDHTLHTPRHTHSRFIVHITLLLEVPTVGTSFWPAMFRVWAFIKHHVFIKISWDHLKVHIMSCSSLVYLLSNSNALPHMVYIHGMLTINWMRCVFRECYNYIDISADIDPFVLLWGNFNATVGRTATRALIWAIECKQWWCHSWVPSNDVIIKGTLWVPLYDVTIYDVIMRSHEWCHE